MLCAVLAGLAYTPAQAQSVLRFTLVDASTDEPISRATFHYADTAGLTGPDGAVVVTRQADAHMTIRHASYGIWTLDPDQLLTAHNEGSVARDLFSHAIAPVRLIVVRPRTVGTTPGLDRPIVGVDNLSHDAGALLTEDPSVSAIRKAGAYGFDPVLRGFKYDQLNVVLDDAQSATAACPNRMDPATSQMAPNMVERVEVHKGPHALRFGTGLGGTVRFVTGEPVFTDSLRLRGRLTSGYISNGTVIRSEGMVGLSGSRWDVQGFGAWARGDDYTDGDGHSVAAGFMRGSAGLRAAVQVAEDHVLQLHVQRNLARDAEFAGLPMDLRSDDTWMVNLRHEAMASGDGPLESWTTTVHATFVDHVMDNLDKDLMPRMADARTDATTRTWGGRTEGHWQFANGSGLYAGGDLRVEEARGERTRTLLMGPMAGRVLIDDAWQAGRIARVGLFGEYHMHRGRWHITAAGRLSIERSDVLEPAGEFLATGTETRATLVNPSISVGVRRDLRGDQSIGLWVARAQRGAGLTDRFINFFPVGLDPYELVGNPMLRPEANHQIDLVYGLRTPSTVLEVNGFAAVLTDPISSVIDEDLSPRMPMSPGVRRFVNLDAAVQAGGEIRWTQELVGGLHHDLSAAYTVAQVISSGDPLPEIAPFDLRLAVYGLYLNDRLRPEVAMRSVRWQTRVAPAFGEQETPTFTTLDASLAYSFPRFIDLRAGVDNILDLGYAEHLNRAVRGTGERILAPGRTVHLSVSLRFD